MAIDYPKKIVFEKFKSLGLLKICEIPIVKSFETFKALILYEKTITRYKRKRK